MTTSPFSILPGTARKDAISSFTVNIPLSQLERTKTLLSLSNIAEECYENSMPDGAQSLGLRREWLIEARRVWETEFDWRTIESNINSFPNFTTSVPISRSPSKENIKIHFIGIFSSNPSATPVVLLHGWPGSILEYLPLLNLFLSKYPDPTQLPYHFIVPSLPGFTLSEPFPRDQHYGMEDVADVINHLMTTILGFNSYLVQGGDIGSRIGRVLGARYKECTSVLLNYSAFPAPEGFDMSTLSEKEMAGVKRGEWFRSNGCAYAMEQGTRPATIGLALSTNPVALLAWVGEKYLEWTDEGSFPPDAEFKESGYKYSKKLMQEIIASVAFYWVTGKIHSSFYSYREAFALQGPAPSSNAMYEVRKPKRFGFSYFPMEVMPTPRKWIEGYTDVEFWREHEVGGHFAALEQPGEIMRDLEDFVKGMEG
ncbi:putative hydrolase [Podospora fimiseda]|uniref:Hydrolase n=1 Tax=Podospora fimiseda TaxID=252190 RepID=A0AAN7BRL0_9PEZI|nr:putative hydrolase [Podospora fimiseda]